MPKRRFGERDGGSPAAPRRLYLVSDDWEFGYNISTLSLPADSGEDAGQGFPTLFWRMKGLREFPQLFTSAFGTKIMGEHQIIDVHTRFVISGPETNYPADPIYFPVDDDRLFALDSGAFDLCRFPPEKTDAEIYPAIFLDESESGSDSSESEWSWDDLPVPPFLRVDVVSYAFHPNSSGHSILVSIKSDDLAAATFSFETGVFRWIYLGEWTLPFTGRGHYASELRALVGLAEDKKDKNSFGYLYACDVLTCYEPNTDNPPPAWKRSKEKVFNKNPAEEHVSASLIYLGDRCKFCLVECVLVEQAKACQEVKEDKDDQVLVLPEKPQCRIYMYRLMTFSLKYDKMGDLRVRHCRVRYYNVPSEVSSKCIRQGPVVFWL